MTDTSGGVTGREPTPQVGRALTPADFGSEVAVRLRFERAAPRRLRRADLHPEVRDAFAALWDRVVAEAYDELRDRRRWPPRPLSARDLGRLLARLEPLVEAGNQLAIVAGVHHPLPVRGTWGARAVAGGSAGTTTALGQAGTLLTSGTAAAVTVATAVLSELFELYVCASARTARYQWASRSPTAATIAADLAAALGATPGRSRLGSRQAAAQLLTKLTRHLAERLRRRLAARLVPVAGVAWSAGVSVASVAAVQRLPLAPPDEEELLRLAADQYGAEADPFGAGRALLGGSEGSGSPGPGPETGGS